MIIVSFCSQTDADDIV